MADRIAVMNLGEALQVGAPEEIYERPHTRFVADFIGETNFIKGRLCERNGSKGYVELTGGHRVGAVLDDPGINVGSEVTVAIRPEKLTVLPTNGAVQKARNAGVDIDEILNFAHREGDTTLLPGKIEQSIYIGTDTRHVVSFGYNGSSAQLVVRTQNFRRNFDQRFDNGDDVYVYWVDENARVLSD
jgi:spermidine/putrescine transport system ATP-binding protein